jgi:DNA (cytosine-5)-methyltransferase 1
MKYLSVCSGIEAATVAWHGLGWQPVAFSEIEKFPSAVLAHHYPTVPNLGDMTNYKEWNIGQIDLLVGGTPCQSFSVAGLRKGLDDPRGNLCLVYLGLAARFQPRWILWENVPGVLSSGGGRDFGSFLGALAELGYGWAHAVRDAQYFGVPQRRRRVFVVGYLGDWRRATAVLFERHSLSGNPPPSREKRERTASYTPSSFGNYSEGTGTLRKEVGDLGGGSENLICAPLSPTVTNGPPFSRTGNERVECEALVCAIQGSCIGRSDTAGPGGSGYDDSGVCFTLTKTDRHAVAFPIDTQNMSEGHNSGGKGYGEEGDPSFTLGRAHSHAVAFGVAENPDLAHCLRSGASKADKHESTTYIASPMQVRRLTPTECERLQGFPDGYTNIPWRGKPESPDEPRYKALGNSMAVPCMRWLGERIQMVDNI